MPISRSAVRRRICGKIMWLRDPIDSKTGQPQIDDKNPNPALAQRPIIGLSIFIGMQTVAANKWSGRIYNADDGQTYTAHVTLPNDASLEVQGCVGVSAAVRHGPELEPARLPRRSRKNGRKSRRNSGLFFLDDAQDQPNEALSAVAAEA